MLFLGSVGVFFVFFAEPVVRLFTRDADVVPLAASCLRILSYGNIGYAYGMVMLQAFNGAGDTLTPTFVNLFGFWFLEIPLAYWLAIPMHLRSNGVFYSIVVAQCAVAAAGVVLFKRGRWKQQKNLASCPRNSQPMLRGLRALPGGSCLGIRTKCKMEKAAERDRTDMAGF